MYHNNQKEASTKAGRPKKSPNTLFYWGARMGTNIEEPESTTMTLILADHSEICPWGIIKEVPVKVNDLLIPVDFVIVSMCGEEETPLILGKPFLAASRALIPDEQKELVLRTDDKEEAHHEE
ncbi:hypothetical protein A2U01_0022718 [Trifolium medium]|uniref:Uncharacterized protein n=1 Tax=Trifolium medium TaxID=97028 RepID=A0A392NPB3_9FABA|nr:hypothetical protein [Trifolium medium]